MKIKTAYSVTFIGRPSRRDIILSELSDFTEESEAFVIQLESEDKSTTFTETITLVTISPPSLGDCYTLTLEKSSPGNDETS